MMLSDVGRTVQAYADGLEAAGAKGPTAWLRKLAAVLCLFENNTVSDLVRRALESSHSSFLPPNKGNPRSAEILPHLRALERVLKASDAPLAADLALLIEFVERDSGYLEPMLDALRKAFSTTRPDARVGDFVARLKSQIGSDAFEQTLAELEASALRREQMVDIARSVYGGIPKSTSRKTALKFIRKPHDAYMSAKRGIDATGGRSAA